MIQMHFMPIHAKAIREVANEFNSKRAFGPNRMIWGDLGMTLYKFQKAKQRLNELFAFASEAARQKICGLNAKTLLVYE